MKRSWLIFVIALTAGMGALVAAWGTALQRDQQTLGFADPASVASLPYFVPRLGVNADLTLYAPDDRTEQIDRMRAAGMHWVRQFFRWNLIEREPGVFDWSLYDGVVEPFRARPDIKLVAVLVNAPTWASRSTPLTRASAFNLVPDDPQHLAAFARAFATRYGAVIDEYQIWDEPNLGASWGAEPHPAAYAVLLQAAYGAIHSTDAEAIVLAAALAPTVETGPQNISDLIYLDDLYRLGLADFSDAVAAKPYGFNAAADDRDFDPSSPRDLKFARVAALREVMLSHGDGRTPLWASEWGWNALADDWAGEPSIWGRVTPEEQVRQTLQALEIAAREWPWMGGMILSEWQPAAPRRDNARWGFALMGMNGQPGPVYDALAARQASLPAAMPDAYEAGVVPAPIGLHHPANPNARYSGVWTFSDLGADLGWVNDSQVEFTFEGTAISLLLRENDYVAYLYATVDDQPANALPRDANGDAYLVLTSDTRAPQLSLVTIAHDLPPGTHTLRLAADRGWDQWALAGYAVSGGDLRLPFDRQIALGLVTAAVGFGAAAAAALACDWHRLRRPLAAMWARLGSAGQVLLSGLAAAILMLGMLLTWTDATPNFFRREPIQLGIAILSAGLVYMNPALMVTLAAALLLFLVFCQRPQIGLTLTIFFAPFFLFPVDLFRFAFPMSEVLILLTTAAWVARGALAWARRFRGGRDLLVTAHPTAQIRFSGLDALDILMAALLALGLVGYLIAVYRAPAMTELRTLFVEPALFYIIMRTLPLSRADLLRLVDALVLSGVVVAAIGLILYVRGDAIITAEEGARRLASVYGSPNNVGLWLGRCLPFSLALALAPLGSWRRGASAAALLIMLVALVLTQSAGALFIGLPVGLVVTLLLIFGRRAWLPLAGVAALFVAALPFLLQFPRFVRLLDPLEGTNFIRLRVWQSAAAAIRDHPIAGLGLDQFLYFFRGRYILPDAWLEPNLSHPHNLVLDVWLRLGAAGVVVVLGLLVLFFRAMLGHARRLRAQETTMWALAVGALGTMSAVIAHGLVDNSLFVNDLAYVFVLLIGLASALRHVGASAL